MSAQVLELCAVRKAFGGLVAVDEVDLSVSEHELVAIVGPSGSGKSTLLRLVAGLAHVDSGEIRIGGNVVDDGVRHVDPEHRHTGLVFQEHALFPHLTVAENITFGLRGTSRAERGQRCEDWLEIVGLAGHGSRYPHELSGGERQRVALARALAPRPRLMLLDEPFASLDPNLRRRLRREIVDVLRRTRTPALFVTHDQTDALTIGDRVAVMCRGRIEQVGEPDAVFHRPINRFVAGFMGEATFFPVDPEDRRCRRRARHPSRRRRHRPRSLRGGRQGDRRQRRVPGADPHVLAAAAERHDRDVHPASRHGARGRQRGGGNRGRRTSLARPRCRQGSMSDVTSANSALGWVDDIERATNANTNFRTVLFTGKHLQLTVMSLAVGENIGWEMHDHLDQFLRVEAGTGTLKLGTSADDVTEEHPVSDDWAMIIPAGTWHDVVNEGDSELKLYSVYAPPDHPAGTVHATKADAEAAEAHGSGHDHHAEEPAD
jgi:ABC-type Fe3+/spermidine/putrescine transport system ATPase subunit/mannose-6-phosphate isomerase-like protein (cupin superfamily)